MKIMRENEFIMLVGIVFRSLLVSVILFTLNVVIQIFVYIENIKFKKLFNHSEQVVQTASGQQQRVQTLSQQVSGLTPQQLQQVRVQRVTTSQAQGSPTVVQRVGQVRRTLDIYYGVVSD